MAALADAEAVSKFPYMGAEVVEMGNPLVEELGRRRSPPRERPEESLAREASLIDIPDDEHKLELADPVGAPVVQNPSQGGAAYHVKEDGDVTFAYRHDDLI